MAKNDLGGIWRTVGGRRIFIKDGIDLATAMKESGKFNTNKKSISKEEQREINQVLNNDEYYNVPYARGGVYTPDETVKAKLIQQDDKFSTLEIPRDLEVTNNQVKEWNNGKEVKEGDIVKAPYEYNSYTGGELKDHKVLRVDKTGVTLEGKTKLEMTNDQLEKFKNKYGTVNNKETTGKLNEELEKQVGSRIMAEKTLYEQYKYSDRKGKEVLKQEFNKQLRKQKELEEKYGKVSEDDYKRIENQKMNELADYKKQQSSSKSDGDKFIRNAFNKYKSEHPNSKMTLSDFKKNY